MNSLFRGPVGCLLAFILLWSGGALGFAQEERKLPEPLKTWEGWVLWNQTSLQNPPFFNNADVRPAIWPARLSLGIEAKSGRFSMLARVYESGWVRLPGSADMWPQRVTANGSPAAVLNRGNVPSVKLRPGFWRLAGEFQWDELPQSVNLPPATGILDAVVSGKPLASPTWDSDGTLWLKQEKSGEAEKDFLSVQVYREIQDGIPMWLNTEVELTVSGKSREEEIGNILPEGWRLAMVSSSLPVALDESGKMKAQVRAGRWKIRITAFRLNNVGSFGYAPGVKPAVPEELIAFKADPEFRMVELSGLVAVDVAQTTMPDEWRELPVYRWNNSEPFQLQERMRGVGLQKAQGLSIQREWWLDQDGKGLTFKDQIGGTSQEVWRLDAAGGQDLGSVRVNGAAQLITLNPESKAAGVELRSRTLSLEATGRSKGAGSFSATGWKTGADSVQVTLNLPPGWRLLGVLGSDWVKGDWLTAWTLFDLFLLMVFSLSVYKLLGWKAGLLALAAYGLGCHEAGAPVYLWFLLLVPLSLLRVAPKEGWGYKPLLFWKWIALGALIWTLIPFSVSSLQSAMYPQLERSAVYGGPDDFIEAAMPVSVASSANAEAWQGEQANVYSGKKVFAKGNMLYDTRARIQTGPGIPEWTWRRASFGWNGPVTEDQTVRPIFIPMGLERVLVVLRLILILALAGVMAGLRLPQGMFSAKAPLILAGMFFLWPGTEGKAQIPGEKMLDELRARLTKTSDAFPNAAEIPQASIQIRDRKIIVECEIHAGAETGVPLPGKLPAWSPLSVSVDGKSDVPLLRADDFLWVALAPGVHRVKLEGMLPGGTDWEWAFLLKPKRVNIDAPGWSYTGVRPNGVPEAQVFFNRQQQSQGSEASYDRRDYQAVIAVDRSLEIGLVWKVKTVIRRISDAGKAVSLRVPLLPGENVLSSTVVINGNIAEVRLGSQEQEIEWESELPIQPSLELVTRPEDNWVETWTLNASPVWNVRMSGLAPVFGSDLGQLTPIWHPWPGEKATLSFNRPEAVQGGTLTIKKVQLVTKLGQRQRACTLSLDAECSLGEDLAIGIPAGAQVGTLLFNDTAIPVRKDGDKLVIPLRPGAQKVKVEWKENRNLGVWTKQSAVSLPVEAANVSTVLDLSSDRWVLWTSGPLIGPAVRFWPVILFALLAAFLLGRLPLSPIKTSAWILLVAGLSQVHVLAALLVAGWFFAMAARGKGLNESWKASRFNYAQMGLMIWSLLVLLVLLASVSNGLLGKPRMLIAGNGSSAFYLEWFQARSGGELPVPAVLSLSQWWYRLLMLAWAFWLALSLLRWSKWAWKQFSQGGLSRSDPEERTRLHRVEPPAPPGQT